MSHSDKNIFKGNVDPDFDISDISDVPASLQKNITSNRKMNQTTALVIELFNMKNQLTIAELLVALWRKYKVEKKKDWANSSIGALIRRGMVKRIQKGSPIQPAIYERVFVDMHPVK